MDEETEKGEEEEKEKSLPCILINALLPFNKTFLSYKREKASPKSRARARA